MNPAPMEFTSARDKMRDDYWHQIYQQLKVTAINAGTKCVGIPPVPSPYLPYGLFRAIL